MGQASRHRCSYCGSRTATERDHVPPKGLFSSPRPSNLITVPVCSACHRSTHKDDEYFRTVLALRADVDGHPDVAGGIAESALRSLSRKRAGGYARSLLESIVPAELSTPTGIVLGKIDVMRPNPIRLVRVVARITRGLYFHHLQRPLGPDCKVKVLEDSMVDWSRLSDEIKTLVVNTSATLRSQSQLHIGTAFAYSYLLAQDDPRRSAWLLQFYDKFVFLALTDYPPIRLQDQKAK